MPRTTVGDARLRFLVIVPTRDSEDARVGSVVQNNVGKACAEAARGSDLPVMSCCTEQFSV
jgi:hypothetical protein